MGILLKYVRLIASAMLVAASLVLFGGQASQAGAQEQPAPVAEPVTLAQDPDVTPPVIPLLANLYAEAIGPGGASVIYQAPIATDNVNAQIVSICAPASGSLFPLGTTAVICSATDAAGNRADLTAFTVTVGDSTPPAISQPGNLRATAADESGAGVSFDTPTASDAVSGALAASCAPASGALFPIGDTVVTCSAVDGSGNAASASFVVTVDPPVIVEPTATTAQPEPTPTEEPVPTQEPTVEPTPEITPTPAALGLPWPPPPPANPIYGSGPIDGLAVIWGGLSFPISQEYGHTLFSLSQPTLYQYGAGYGLDGRAHPGLDIGMGRGTYLYSPVNGTVVAAGGTGGFGFYGNTLPDVGELRIQTADGNQVILGHMAAISVYVGDEVTIGQFVGISGGDNGDHLHLETRHASGAGYVIVDPRVSFLIPVLQQYNAAQAEAIPEPIVDELEDEIELPAENPTGQTDSGLSDGNGSTINTPEDEVSSAEQDAGLSDGNGEPIAAPQVDEARRDEDPETDSTPDASLILESLITPPAASMDATKRGALDAIMSRQSG